MPEAEVLTPEDPVRDIRTGRFLVGNPGNGGRRPGARSLLGEQFLDDLQCEWQRRGKDALRELDALELCRVMAIVSKPFIAKLAHTIGDTDVSLPDNLEALVERARIEHGPRAATLLRRYIREVHQGQGED
jgi:hypothetical protein